MICQVPASVRKNVQLRFKATAGLRLLPQSTQDALLDSVYEYIRNYSPYIIEREWVGVITGVEEAVGAWVTVNYLLGAFASGRYVGTMDLGGGSVQVSSIPVRALPH